MPSCTKRSDTGDDQALNHWYVKVYGNGREYTLDVSGTRRQLGSGGLILSTS